MRPEEYVHAVVLYARRKASNFAHLLTTSKTLEHQLTSIFYTFKNLSILLGILAVVYSIFAIITNGLAAGASISTLYKVDYISISLAAKQSNDTTANRRYYFIQCWLGLVVVLVWGLVLVGIKYNEIKN